MWKQNFEKCIWKKPNALELSIISNQISFEFM